MVAGHSCNISCDQAKIFNPSTWSHLWAQVQVFMFLFMSRNYLRKVSSKTTEIDVDIKLYPTLTHLSNTNGSETSLQSYLSSLNMWFETATL